MRDLPRAYRLADGALVHVRHVRPSDERMLRAAFRELSARSRYQRFLGPVSELSDALWRYLCDVDGRDHVALVALDGESRAVGVARFVRQWMTPSGAEVAITVADAWQAPWSRWAPRRPAGGECSGAAPSKPSSRTPCRTTSGSAGCSLDTVRCG